jgi:hypothetical protein
MPVLEFWPDHGAGPLWTARGAPADPHQLGLPEDLAERISTWNARYDEGRIPVEGPGDNAWLAEGKELLDRVRRALGVEYRVIVTEPWWGEDPT